jgi:hypothetical protein
MKKIILSAIMILIFALPAAAGESCCPSSAKKQMDQTSKVDGYQLEYTFIDLKEKMKGMDHSMEGMTATHHLMVYIKNAKGDTVAADKVGFLITGPDEKDQKVMTMGMSGGYGADINLSEPGDYTIKTKAIVGEQKLIDAFTYTIK